MTQANSVCSPINEWLTRPWLDDFLPGVFQPDLLMARVPKLLRKTVSLLRVSCPPLRGLLALCDTLMPKYINVQRRLTRTYLCLGN